ncbi:MAG: CDP-glycerol--poly(glycerophosphate) glycerophosphotransferase [Proteobacteria bacterium]|nr:MAG: CDP-glycerol--poly(glycerophosphate) glycerophosphotransferase [Pseudomonadota bacterium]
MTSFARKLAAPIAARLLKKLTGWTPEASGSPFGHAIVRSRSLARTAFLFHTPELLNHFARVMDLLPAGSFDLVVCRDAENSQEVQTAAARWKSKVIPVSEVISSRRRYDWLVSNHPTMLGDPSIFKHLAAINVRFMYAIGKSGWNLSAWNSLYDVILCFGPYHAVELARRTNAAIVQMGYPRLDGFFTEPSNRDNLRKRFNCDPIKQTVVWLPTWKELSTVGVFDEQVSGLMSEYNVIVKVHPLMVTTEPQRVAGLRRFRFTQLITDASDNLALYQLADFMLFDYGGPPFAAVYTDKKMLLLNIPAAEKDALTGVDSPDITIRRTMANINQTEGDIGRLLRDEQLWTAQKRQRQVLRREYFAPYYGYSANVAALALSNLEHIVGAKPGT